MSIYSTKYYAPQETPWMFPMDFPMDFPHLQIIQSGAILLRISRPGPQGSLQQQIPRKSARPGARQLLKLRRCVFDAGLDLEERQKSTQHGYHQLRSI